MSKDKTKVKHQELTADQAEAALANWPACNDFLRDATEVAAGLLLATEKAGKRRVQYLMRIHARFNRERARRERAELLSGSGG